MNLPVQITTNLMALYLVFVIGYETAKSFNKNPLPAGLISLACFLLLTPQSATARVTTEAGETVSGTISGYYAVSYFGATGLFMAMIVGILAARVYILLIEKNIKISMPESVPSNVATMFESMLPGGIVMLLFVVIQRLSALTSYGTFYSLIYGLIQTPLMKVGTGPVAYIVWVCAGIWLWMFGIHGGMVAYAAFASIYQTTRIANMEAFANGVAAPYPYWSLWYWYIIGGTGCTLALSILMNLRAKSSQSKVLGKLTIVPSIFNINEPMIFGAPIIMNAYLALPFCLVPLVNLALTALVMNLGLVAWPTGANISAFMPVIIQPAMANGSWTGAVWQLILLVLDVILYYPFYKQYDEDAYRQETEGTAE